MSIFTTKCRKVNPGEVKVRIVFEDLSQVVVPLEAIMRLDVRTRTNNIYDEDGQLFDYLESVYYHGGEGIMDDSVDSVLDDFIEEWLESRYLYKNLIDICREFNLTIDNLSTGKDIGNIKSIAVKHQPYGNWCKYKNDILEGENNE